MILKNFRLNDQIVETRLLMRHPDGVWAGYTYEWNDAQTAATRVIGGKTRSVQGQTWIYPSEGACLQCHTSAAGFSLGPEIAQLNGSLTYAETGRTANQLDTLAGIGMFSAPLPGPSGSLPALVDPSDSGASLSDRARDWLHTNCSQCHRPGGPTPSNMDLRFSTALERDERLRHAAAGGRFRHRQRAPDRARRRRAVDRHLPRQPPRRERHAADRLGSGRWRRGRDAERLDRVAVGMQLVVTEGPGASDGANALRLPAVPGCAAVLKCSPRTSLPK